MNTPIQPLMKEHRLIEKMLAQLTHELELIKEGIPPDIILLERSGDFLCNFADRIHHGKEDILFDRLESKGLSPMMRGMKKNLIREHKRFREATWVLRRALQSMRNGDERTLEIAKTLAFITRFYSGHIQTEDGGFFIAMLELFSDEEMDEIMEEFEIFDRGKDHQRYQKMIEVVERKRKVEA